MRVLVHCEELPLSETDSEYVQSRVDREWISQVAQPQQASGRQLDLSSNSLMSRCRDPKMPTILILDSSVDGLSPSLAATPCAPPIVPAVLATFAKSALLHDREIGCARQSMALFSPVMSKERSKARNGVNLTKCNQPLVASLSRLIHSRIYGGQLSILTPLSSWIAKSLTASPSTK